MTEDKENFEDFEVAKARRERLVFATNWGGAGVVIIFFSILGFLINDEFSSWFVDYNTTKEEAKAGMVVFISFMLLIGFSIITFSYLNGFRPFRSSADETLSGADLDAMSEVIARIEESTKSLAQRRNISETDQKIIQDIMKDAIDKNIKNSLLDQIDRKYSRNAVFSNVGDLGVREFDKAIGEKTRYQIQLTTRGNVYVSAGVFVALVGVLILYFLVVQEGNREYINTIDQFFYYFGRLSLFIAIEAVAIFFFRQYKFSIENEVKISSEITALNVTKMSYLTNLKTGNSEGANQAIKNIMGLYTPFSTALIDPTDGLGSDKLIELSKLMKQK